MALQNRSALPFKPSRWRQAAEGAAATVCQRIQLWRNRLLGMHRYQRRLIACAGLYPTHLAEPLRAHLVSHNEEVLALVDFLGAL